MDENARALLQWIDHNATSIVQALRMAAENNDAQSTSADAAGEHTVARVMAESARSWNRLAEDLNQAYESVAWDRVLS